MSGPASQVPALSAVDGLPHQATTDTWARLADAELTRDRRLALDELALLGQTDGGTP